jgi:hypothetical protein
MGLCQDLQDARGMLKDHQWCGLDENANLRCPECFALLVGYSSYNTHRPDCRWEEAMGK